MTPQERSRLLVAGSISEAQWQATVESALLATGHRFAHFRPARTKGGWRTAMSGHPGYPDITAISRQGVLKVAELKTVSGQVGAEQAIWLQRFAAAGAVVAVLRAGDEVALKEFLK